MNSRIFSGIIFLLLIFHFSNGQTITMNEYLELVKKSHPFFLKESLSSEIEIKKQARFLGSHDWFIRSSPFYLHQKPISSSPFSPEQIDMVRGDIAVEKAFWKTGGRFSLSYLSDYTNQKISDIIIPLGEDNIVFPAGSPEVYTNKVYLTYTQPLLQNFAGKLDRLNYELSGYNITLSKIQAAENQEEFVKDVAIRFLDWVLLSEQKRIANERLNLAQEQLKQIEKRWAAHLVDRVDVLRAEDAIRIAKQGVMLIESQLKSKQAELAVFAQSNELYDMNPEFNLYHMDSLPELDKAVSELMEKSRILGSLNVLHEQLSYILDGFTETKRPQLFFNIGAGLQSGDTVFTNSFGFDQPDILVSLDFRYPLDTRTAKADIKKTNLELKHIKHDIENIALNLEARLRNLLILIRELENVLQLNQEQIESAEAKTSEELRLYNQGRSDLTFVIQSQDNEQVAKLTRVENAVSYQKLILHYHALMDELLSQ